MGESQQPTPAAEWIAIPVPAIISQDTFEMVQRRLERNVQMARRNNTAHAYLLRGLVSCGQCRLISTGQTRPPVVARRWESKERLGRHRSLPRP